MALATFASMYVLMYAMVDTLDDVYPNLNQLYMTGLMTAAMVAIELLLMREMYTNPRANAAILAGSSLALALCFTLIREQSGITDRQLMKTMIPHHSSVIRMCKRAPLQDPELGEMCATVVATQQSEIDELKAMLRATMQ